MERFQKLEDLWDRGPLVLAIGFFDGFHVGHQAVLAEARRMAKARGAAAGVVTFSPHPASVLFPERPVQLLQTEEEKETMMASLGMALAVILRPTQAFLGESAEEFLRSLRAVPGLRGVVCGENFSFGAGASGGPGDIARYFAGTDTAVSVVPLAVSEAIGGRVVSSTEIRRLVQEGDMRRAGALLGRYYSLSGGVARGFRRGTDDTGYPTANLAFGRERILPADGVYAAFARIRGRRFPAVTNVGTNPTFGNDGRTVETFILDFDESIYGEAFAVEFVERLRGEIRFPSVAALAAQIGSDVQRARELLQAEALRGASSLAAGQS